MFLQVDWDLHWEGEYFLSHGTNLSVEVAILFSPRLNVKVLPLNALEKGRLLMVRVKIKDMEFIFIKLCSEYWK